MKKLLLILLFLPSIGYTQNFGFNFNIGINSINVSKTEIKESSSYMSYIIGSDVFYQIKNIRFGVGIDAFHLNVDEERNPSQPTFNPYIFTDYLIIKSDYQLALGVRLGTLFSYENKIGKYIEMKNPVTVGLNFEYSYLLNKNSGITFGVTPTYMHITHSNKTAIRSSTYIKNPHSSVITIPFKIGIFFKF